MPIELVDLEAHAVIAESLDLIQPLADRLSVTVELRGRPVDVCADRRRLQQVMLNLL